MKATICVDRIITIEKRMNACFLFFSLLDLAIPLKLLVILMIVH